MRPGRPAWAAGVVLAVVLAVLAGYLVGRSGAGSPPPARPAAQAGNAHASHGAGGLEISANGYTLQPLGAPLALGRPGELVFRILGPDGAALTRYRLNHERALHLVLARRDLTGYRHAHPTMTPDGTWRTPVTLTAAGDYRMIVDFQPEGRDQQVVLGADIAVAGRYAPRPLPAEEPTILTDGYTVTLDGGLRVGHASQILVWLGRDGVPVNDPQPYLGAYGHLVALRQGDLGYLHVHPAVARTPSSVVAFTVQVPSPGDYRLYFEFRHGDVVHLAEFTLQAR